MLATRAEVAECYRVFLLREPENERVIDRQLEENPSVIEVAHGIVSSNEYKAKVVSRPHVSLNKCFDGDYLFKDLAGAERVRFFLHHYAFLSSALAPGCFREILFNGMTILTRSAENDYVVRLRAPSAIINEGELSLAFRMNGEVLCELSFSFVPSGFLYPEAPSGVLVSRFQGAANTKDQSRQAAKDMGDLEPKAVLFSCLVGIAEASDVQIVGGVPARLQVCYTTELEDSFTNAYDRFFEAAGFTQMGTFFVAPLPMTVKPLTLVSLSHRRRAMKRRKARAKIALAAREAWTSWSAPEPEANSEARPHPAPRSAAPAPSSVFASVSTGVSWLSRSISLNGIGKYWAQRDPSLGA